MTTTTAKYSPEQVSQRSDAVLSEAVAREVFGAHVFASWNAVNRADDRWEDRGWPWAVRDRAAIKDDADAPVRLYALYPIGGLRLDGYLFRPDDPASCLAVLEHMRQRWAEIAKAGCDDSELRFWEIASDDGGWSVSVRDYDDRIIAQSFHDDASPSLGRQIFECALLASQEML